MNGTCDLDKKYAIKIIFLFILVPLSLHPQNLLNGPNDIVFDEMNNRYLVANWAGNSIVAIDMQSNQSPFMNNVPHAHGMEISDSVLYVASDNNLLLINLFSAIIIKNVDVAGSSRLGHICLDSSYYVYITDWSLQRLFRINLNDNSSTILHQLNSIPVGIYYEESNNRLLVLTLLNNAPILAYDLVNSSLYTVRNTSINDPDAICRDSLGNYYVTSFSDNIVFKFSNDFSIGPEVISTGHGGPSGLGFNMRDNILGITNYNFNSIDLIELNPNNIYYNQATFPSNYILSQNYPNPFNPYTKIKFQIPELSFVTLKIYDILGNEIATLVSEEKAAGSYEIDFIGRELTSGIYFYRIQASNFVETKKMVLLK